MTEKYIVRLEKDDIEFILDLCNVINDNDFLQSISHSSLLSIKKKFETILAVETPKIPYVEK